MFGQDFLVYFLVFLVSWLVFAKKTHGLLTLVGTTRELKSWNRFYDQNTNPNKSQVECFGSMKRGAQLQAVLNMIGGWELLNNHLRETYVLKLREIMVDENVLDMINKQSLTV